MNDVPWCRATLDGLEEQLCRFEQCASRFSRAVEEAQRIWRDAAAREVFSRYLEPYRRDVDAERVGLRGQLQLLRAAVRRMEAAEQPARELQRLSEESTRLGERAEAEARTAHRTVDAALNAAAASRAAADQAQALLASIT